MKAKRRKAHFLLSVAVIAVQFEEGTKKVVIRLRQIFETFKIMQKKKCILVPTSGNRFTRCKHQPKRRQEKSVFSHGMHIRRV